MRKPRPTGQSPGETAPRPAGFGPYAALIAAGGLGGLIITWLLLWLVVLPAADERAATARAKSSASQYAALFEARIRELDQRIATIAAAPEVRQALQDGDETTRREAGRRLAGLFDFAERVEIFPRGQAQLDLDAAVPVSFAALDVVKRAESGAFAGPDAIDGERRAIYAAQPVSADGAVLGVLLVAIAPRYFAEPFATHDPGAGRITLAQSVDDRHAIEIVATGTGAPQADVQRVPLATANWVLRFQPGPDAATPGVDALTLTALFAVPAILLIGSLALAFLRLTTAARHDGALLRECLDTPPGRTPPQGFRLLAFAELADVRATAPAATTAAPAQATPATAPAVAEQTTVPATPDQDFLEIRAPAGPSEPGIEVIESAGPLDLGLRLEPQIFRAYDIRGVTTHELTEDVVYWIGRAFAAEALDAGEHRVAVGRDGRHSSLPLRDALVRGLTDGGCNALDIGQVPTPVLYFATHALETGTGIMITGSHNPPEYNGLKMMLGGDTLAEERIQALRLRIEENRLSEGQGSHQELDLTETYLERITSDLVVARPLKVVVDCGNGVAGDLAPELLRRLDCDVIPLYCDVDGDFPNHHPDPADPANLEDLVTVVKAEQADLGLAFDGDGDRIGVVTGAGTIIWPDKLMMAFAEDIVGRNPGADIVYDVKCSRHLNNLISELGGRPIMNRTGHSHIKARIRETGALLGGEFSGHICFGERWYGFDDALYAAARLLEILGASHESTDAFFARFPQTVSTPELKVATTEQTKFSIIETLARQADFGEGALTTLDGVRVDYADGWGLVRASNTSPFLTLRFEADDAAALDRIQTTFDAALRRIDPGLGFRQNHKTDRTR